MLILARIKTKSLKRFAESGDDKGIRTDWQPRVRRVLNALDIAVSPAELDTPGWHWHELKGDKKGVYSVRISGNWRLTYRWDDEGPYDVTLEDYHGR